MACAVAAGLAGHAARIDLAAPAWGVVHAGVGRAHRPHAALGVCGAIHVAASGAHGIAHRVALAVDGSFARRSDGRPRRARAGAMRGQQNNRESEEDAFHLVMVTCALSGRELCTDFAQV